MWRCWFCFFRASFMTKTVPCGNELHKFLIWDTAGQERVRIPCCWLSKENTKITFWRVLCIWQDSSGCKWQKPSWKWLKQKRKCTLQLWEKCKGVPILRQGWVQILQMYCQRHPTLFLFFARLTSRLASLGRTSSSLHHGWPATLGLHSDTLAS